MTFFPKNLIIVLIVGGLVFLLSQQFLPEPLAGANNPENFVATPSPISTPTPTSDPSLVLSPALRAVTIPGLREQTFGSHLTILQTLEETTSYISYLTTFESDGWQQYGLLALPQKPAPEAGWPLIMLVHGYVNPQAYATNGQPYRAWWQAVVRTGEFAVFKIDLRGHGQAEGQPVATYYAPDYVRDILNAYQALQEFELLDRQRIGLWSHSSASNLVLRAAAVHQNIPALSLWGGSVATYTDFCEFKDTDGSQIPNPAAYLAALQTENPELSQLLADHQNGICDRESVFWEAMTPTNFLVDARTAIQIQHAVTDETINFAYAANLSETLNQKNIVHEFNHFSRGDHNFNYIFDEALNKMLLFFQKM
jgi:pimeloyl-ACP methyl ester carboxylesterase